jgi:hypothetical protein
MQPIGFQYLNAAAGTERLIQQRLRHILRGNGAPFAG